MSIFPSETIDLSNVIQSTTSTSTDLPLFTEYAWDFDKNNFALVNGKTVVVTGQDALNIWMWKTLQTPRYRYLAYSWNYGHEFDDLIDQGLSSAALKSELERYLKESLLVNPYIASVKDIDIELDGSKASASFTVETVYGEVSLTV